MFTTIRSMVGLLLHACMEAATVICKQLLTRVSSMMFCWGGERINHVKHTAPGGCLPVFLISFEAWAQKWLVCAPLRIHLEPIN